MDPLRVAVRSLAAFVFLLALLRLAGKRAIAQGTPFDFVLALILGDLVDDLLWAEVPASQFVVAAGTLGLVHTLASLASHARPSFARLLAGEPVVFLRQGSPAREGLRRERLSGGEMEEMLRLQGLDRADWAEVEEARVEESGGISLTRRESARDAQKRDAAWVPGKQGR
jgi:uncharacterized membrane protein YcaP (DUF421 family)